MATFSASAIFKAVDQMTAPMTRMERSMKKFGAVTQETKHAIIGLAGGLAIGSVVAVGARAITQFDSSVASLKSITGLAGKDFEKFKTEIFKVGDATNKSYVEVAKAMELIGSAQPELLSNASAMGEMTKAAILLSKASGMDLTTSAGSLAKAMNTFGVGADQAAKFVDILSTSEQKGTATTEQIIAALINGGSTAKTMKMSFEETNAFIQAFAKAGVIGSEAGTQMAAVLSKGAKMTRREFNPTIVGASKAIDNMAKAHLSYTDLLKITDAEGAKFFSTLINQNDVIQSLNGNLYDVGNAQKQAAERSKAFNVRITELVAKFENLAIKGSETSGVLNIFGGILGFITNNLGLLLGTIGVVLTVFAAYKIATLTTTAAMWLYNTALDFSILSQGYQGVALLSGTFAMNTYNFATKAAAVGQWIFNASLYGCPIVWIIVGIMALIAVIVLLVKNWKNIIDWIQNSDSVFAKVIRVSILPFVLAFKMIKGAIMFVIDAFVFLFNWLKDIGAFQPFINMFNDIKALFVFVAESVNYLVEALASLWDWLSKIGGMAIEPIMALLDIFDSTAKGEINVKGTNNVKPVNKDAVIEEKRSITEKNSTNKVQINVNDPQNRLNVQTTSAMPIVINNTKTTN